MNSRLNEDMAWLRVQDMQREAHNRRLMSGERQRPANKALWRLFEALAGWSRRTAGTSVARGLPDHHAAIAAPDHRQEIA
jgi:hypothetical protein